MARDYKYRAQGKNASRGGHTASPLRSVGFWKWMLITVLTIIFAVFLVYLKEKGEDRVSAVKDLASQPEKAPLKSLLTGKPEEKQADSTNAEPEQHLPRFDFYNLLPKKEVVVPDHEINIRTREEHVGKAKEAQYMMQAGSFKTFKEADQQRAKLGLLGIESKVLKGKVGNVIWYRVKIGPYARMTSVSAIKSRLRQNGIDVIVTETGE